MATFRLTTIPPPQTSVVNIDNTFTHPWYQYFSNLISRLNVELIRLEDNSVSFKNKLINGNFDLWQRGTSLGGAGYIADRWRVSPGDGTQTSSRQSFTIGQTAVPNSPIYYINLNRTVAATTSNQPIAQRVEDVRSLTNRQVTFSFWAKISSGTKLFTPRLVQSFGTGGSPSANVIMLGSAKKVTTTWTRFVQTFSIPSISGKTLGTNNDSYLQVDLSEESSFSTFSLDFAQAQLELGKFATGFDKRFLAEEVNLAERYYQKSYDLTVNPGTATEVGRSTIRMSASNATIIGLESRLSTRMRTIPTITWYSSTTGTANRLRNATTAADLTISSTTGLSESITGVPVVTAAPADGDAILAQYTLDAEL